MIRSGCAKLSSLARLGRRHQNSISTSHLPQQWLSVRHKATEPAGSEDGELLIEHTLKSIARFSSRGAGNKVPEMQKSLQVLAKLAQSQPLALEAQLLKQPEHLASELVQRHTLPGLSRLPAKNLTALLSEAPLGTLATTLSHITAPERLPGFLEPQQAADLCLAIHPVVTKKVNEIWGDLHHQQQEQQEQEQQQPTNTSQGQALQQAQQEQEQNHAAATAVTSTINNLMPSCLTLAAYSQQWPLLQRTCRIMALMQTMGPTHMADTVLQVPPSADLTAPVLARIVTNLHLCDADLSSHRTRIAHLAAECFSTADDVRAVTKHLYPALTSVFPHPNQLRDALRVLANPNHTGPDTLNGPLNGPLNGIASVAPGASAHTRTGEHSASAPSSSSSSSSSSLSSSLSSGGAAVSQRAADSASITGRLASFLHPISALTKSLTDSTSSGHAGAGGAAATTTAAASEREALLARRSPVPSHPHHRPDPLVATHSGNAAAAGSPRHLQQLWSMLAHYSAWRGDVVALNVALMYLQEHGLELAAEAQPGVARAVFNANNPAVLREVSRLCTQCVEC